MRQTAVLAAAVSVVRMLALASPANGEAFTFSTIGRPGGIAYYCVGYQWRGTDRRVVSRRRGLSRVSLPRRQLYVP